MASDLAGDDLLDRCYCYLEEQGFGILELATLALRTLMQWLSRLALS